VPLLMSTTGPTLTGFALAPSMRAWRRWLTLGVLGVLMLIVAVNIAVFVTLVAQGQVGAGLPLPFSLIVLAGLSVTLFGLLLTPACGDDEPRRAVWASRIAVVGVAGICTLAAPLLQMLCFGYTDYRRPADAIVVFGARAYANGRPSQALADRVRTACDLYNAGLADHLVFSGGPGDGDIHETESMRRYARRLGVPDHAILTDPDGLNTRATVANTVPLLHQHRLRRVIAVSHFYHLPRIKLTYQRAGTEVYTVPAEESYTLTQLPYNMTREVAALWWYYVQPLVA